MNESKSYIRSDEHGVRRVGSSQVMLDSIVAAFDLGHTAETIQQQYPSLSLEEVYGAITYYLANADEVKEYLRRQGEVWEQWRAKSRERASPVVERLRTLQQAEASEPP